jgi:hypothetical protein
MRPPPSASSSSPSLPPLPLPWWRAPSSAAAFHMGTDVSRRARSSARAASTRSSSVCGGGKKGETQGAVHTKAGLLVWGLQAHWHAAFAICPGSSAVQDTLYAPCSAPEGLQCALQ